MDKKRTYKTLGSRKCMSHLQGKKKYLSTIHAIFQNNNSEGKKIVWLQDILENGVRFFFLKNYVVILFNLTQTYVYPTDIYI